MKTQTLLFYLRFCLVADTLYSRYLARRLEFEWKAIERTILWTKH